MSLTFLLTTANYTTSDTSLNTKIVNL